jgi:dihydroorotate dehydrogenase electron transfer subunit
MLVDVRATVLANTHLSDDYHVIALEAPQLAAAAQPGQFVMVKTSSGIDPLLRRPFSFFEILKDDEGQPLGFSLLSKRVGTGTALLYEARPGDRLGCLGPLGRSFPVVAPPTEAWFVAGGVGLAPFAALSDTLREAGVKITLFYGARRAADLHCTEVFARPGISLVLATEDGSLGHRGFVTEAVGQALAARAPDVPLQVYACGPTAMMHATHRLAVTQRWPCDVSLEQVMGCGLGGCYSCVVRVREGEGPPHFVRSCLRGPVFDSRSIVWEELVH